MKKRNFVLGLLGYCFLVLALVSCSDGNECMTCRLNGEIDSLCEDDLTQYNLEYGTNVTSLDQLQSVVEIAGGSCEFN